MSNPAQAAHQAATHGEAGTGDMGRAGNQSVQAVAHAQMQWGQVSDAQSQS